MTHGNPTAVAAFLLVAMSASTAAAAPRTACAARAMKAATDTAKTMDGAVALSTFAKVRPAANEAGAGDEFYDARFTRAGKEALKYHVIMWCKGMKFPMAMAIQPRYD